MPSVKMLWFLNSLRIHTNSFRLHDVMVVMARTPYKGNKHLEIWRCRLFAICKLTRFLHDSNDRYFSLSSGWRWDSEMHRQPRRSGLLLHVHGLFRPLATIASHKAAGNRLFQASILSLQFVIQPFRTSVVITVASSEQSACTFNRASAISSCLSMYRCTVCARRYLSSVTPSEATTITSSFFRANVIQ